MEELRAQLNADVLIVGGGPAGLATACHLSRLIQEHNEKVASGTIHGGTLEKTILLIDKGMTIGAHGFSGAVMDPIALRELIPDFIEQGAPVEGEVKKEAVYFLREKGQFKLPFLPQNVENQGNYVLSLSKLCRWLGDQAASRGVQIFPGFPGVELLMDDKRVLGVRTGDKGIDRHGNQKTNFDPGIDILADATVLAEGPRGTLTRQWLQLPGFGGRYPQVFELGVKEVFEMPEGRVTSGHVIHTLGYPLGSRTSGGGFLYTMGDNLLALGMVVSFDSPDPLLNPHELLQRLKAHPLIQKILRDGRPKYYGAKAICAGGYYTVPKLYTSGGLIVGESASLMNMARLKGVHLAIKSGILAAETLFEAIQRGDYSEQTLSSYRQKVEASYIWSELNAARNFHQAMAEGGLKGFVHLGFQMLTGGRGLVDPMEIRQDHTRTEPIRQYYPDRTDGIEAEDQLLAKDGSYLLDKLSDVFNAGVFHEEDQPSHLKIVDADVCLSCWHEYRSPCTHFCPAQVYEMLPVEGTTRRQLRVNFANCVHCKSCDIKCPHLNILWMPPEGGGGPKYTVQ